MCAIAAIKGEKGRNSKGYTGFLIVETENKSFLSFRLGYLAPSYEQFRLDVTNRAPLMAKFISDLKWQKGDTDACSESEDFLTKKERKQKSKGKSRGVKRRREKKPGISCIQAIIRCRATAEWQFQGWDGRSTGTQTR